jgi:hypothetical protein
VPAGRRIRRDDHPADRPQRENRQLEVRPGERDADYGNREGHGGNKVAKREPPARQHQPDQIAQKTRGAGSKVGSARVLVRRTTR